MNNCISGSVDYIKAYKNSFEDSWTIEFEGYSQGNGRFTITLIVDDKNIHID